MRKAVESFSTDSNLPLHNLDKRPDMKTATWRLLACVLLLAFSTTAQAQEGKITVLIPKGNPPPTLLAPMAARPAGMDGKTIFFVDIGYEGGESLLKMIMEWFAKNTPAANLVFREKAGTYEQEDAKLWAEIKGKADAVILAVGH